LVYFDKLTKLTHLKGFKFYQMNNKIADSLLKEIYRFYGFLNVVKTDRGTQFTRQVLKKLLEFFGTHCKRNTKIDYNNNKIRIFFIKIFFVKNIFS